MKLSVLIAKLQVIEETSGDMDVLWRDGFSSLVPIGDLAILHEQIIVGENRDTQFRPVESEKGELILVIKSASTIKYEAKKAQAA